LSDSPFKKYLEVSLYNLPFLYIFIFSQSLLSLPNPYSGSFNQSHQRNLRLSFLLDQSAAVPILLCRSVMLNLRIITSSAIILLRDSGTCCFISFGLLFPPVSAFYWNLPLRSQITSVILPSIRLSLEGLNLTGDIPSKEIPTGLVFLRALNQ